jgi:hypothetical protein
MEYNMHAALALAAAASRWLPRARGRCLAFAVVASRWWLQPRAGGCSLALAATARKRYRVLCDGQETGLCRSGTDDRPSTTGYCAGRASWACPVKKTLARANANGSFGFRV